jgi:hypothetical protein
MNVTNDRMKTRTLPRSVARVVEELELRQPTVVTRAQLTEFAANAGVSLAEDALAERLVRLGWLLPLRRRDTWEFAPGARAGRYPSGDPWIEIRALLEHQPDAPVAVAFESAVWEQGHSTHQPARPVLAHRQGWRPPETLGTRMVKFDWRLPTNAVRGLPVWREATEVVAAAERPAAQGNWANAEEWLPETFRAVTPDDVVAEAAERQASTLARLGYLAEWSAREDVAQRVEALLPGRLPVSFLGSRDRRNRWSRRWHVYDALLPER